MAKKAKSSKTSSNILPLAEGHSDARKGFAAVAQFGSGELRTSTATVGAGEGPRDAMTGGASVSVPVGRAGKPAAIAEAAAAAAAEARERRQERNSGSTSQKDMSMEKTMGGDKTAAGTTAKDDGDGAFAGMVAASGRDMDPDQTGSADDPMILRKKEFIQQVADRSGLKKQDARRAIDAFLDVMTETLKEGRTLALMPRAKIKPVRQAETGNATVVTTKIRIKDVTVIAGEGALASSED